MKLDELKPNEGAKSKKKRVGRGPGAGQGKTCGRGTKGAGARQGSGGKLYMMGGNLPFFRKLPFMRGEGFSTPYRAEYSVVNLEMLNKLDAQTEVTPEVLYNAGLVSSKENPVVILGNGEIEKALKLKVQRVSKGAKEKIEKAGGSVEVLPFTKGPKAKAEKSSNAEAKA